MSNSVILKSPPRGETPHLPVASLVADEFCRGASYGCRRSRGTEDWLLIFTVAGGGRAAAGGAEIFCRPGTVVLFQPGTPQRYFTDPDAGRWHLAWSHFQPKPSWVLWLNWPETSQGFRTLVLPEGAVRRKIRRALVETVHFSRQGLEESPDFAANALERALLWIHSVNRHRGLDERIWRALNLMAANLRQPLSLPALAKASGLSISRLAHLFTAQVGEAPRKYYEKLRLQRAAQLLRSASLTVSEVAFESGYSNPFHFSKSFKHAFGLNPSRFRAGQTSAKTRRPPLPALPH